MRLEFKTVNFNVDDALPQLIFVLTSLYSDMESQEIIDLTKFDAVEVIDVDAAPNELQHSPADPKRATPLKENTSVIVVEDDLDQQTSKLSKKRKKPRRKKKRAIVDVDGGEDGEVLEVETADDSAQISREVSDEESASEEPVVSTPSSTKKRKTKSSAKGQLNLLARISDASTSVNHGLNGDRYDEDRDEHRDQSKTPSRTRKKQKVREKQRANRQLGKQDAELSPPPPDEPPPFFIDDKPTELPNNSKGTLPPPALLASPAANEPSTSTSKATSDKLLLPPHVSVLEFDGDLPIVEIKAPEPLDSEEEDYIDYVDYDGDQVVSTPLINRPIYVDLYVVERTTVL